MAQTRRQSAVETVASTVIGFVVAVISNELVLPLFGLQPSYTDSIGIAIAFTAISLVRGYGVRRLFNWLHEVRA